MDKDELLRRLDAMPRVSHPESREALLKRLAAIADLARRCGNISAAAQADEILVRESVEDAFRDTP